VSATLAAQQPATPSNPIRPDSQAPPITFRSEVNYVEVDAVVLDAQGRFVRSLSAGDVQVFEDGKRQKVSSFTLVDLPVERFEKPAFLGRAVEPDVQTNAKPADGRMYVLLLDDVHTDLRRTANVRRAARQFVDRFLGANDLAAVVHVSGRSDAAQDFTSNKRLLTQAIDSFSGRKLRSATLNKIDNVMMQRNSPFGSGAAPIDDEEQQRAYFARSLLSTLNNIADYMSSVHGRRKAIILFSEGIDYDINRPMEMSDASIIRQATTDAIGAATRANLNIYALDPRGLTDVGGDEINLIGLPPDDPNAQTLGMTSLRDEVRLSQDSLMTLADETGGFAITNTNNTDSKLQRIVDDNSSYYVLGYYPTNDRRDGKYRKIDVRLASPGLVVHARKGYLAPLGKAPAAKKRADASNSASPAVLDALNSPLQTSGLNVSLFAAPFKGPVPNATLAIVAQLKGTDLTFVEKGGTFTNTVEMSYIIVDGLGKIVTGNRETLQLALKPETLTRVRTQGFRFQARIDVPPGRYSLRMAMQESGGRVGSVFADLTVPNFTKEPLAMSGLVVAAASTAQVPTAGSTDLKDLLPTPPTTLRAFTSKDQLAVLAEVYDNQGLQAHAVEISTTLRADEGKTVFSNTERRQSSELGGARGGYGYMSRVPLTDLAPGLYVLKVEARTSMGKPVSVAREIQIRIVP
jgi:VWFA-related protein